MVTIVKNEPWPITENVGQSDLLFRRQRVIDYKVLYEQMTTRATSIHTHGDMCGLGIKKPAPIAQLS